MGESVVNTGAFHEALNMAGLWKLPIVYVIENNRYGMGTALERASAIHDIYERGASYNIPARDVRRAGRVRGAAPPPRKAIDRARRESLPDSARGPHLPLHGPLDVRRRERHVSHEGRSSTNT
jgi:pyruvate dehydrogenase E1 component alpha subunit